MRTVAARTALACGVLFACSAATPGTAVTAGPAGQPQPTGDIEAWQPAFAAPGLGGTGEPAQPDNGEVSCAGTSYCAMAGYFVTGRTDSDLTAYVWDKIKGSWDTPREFPGLGALNTGGSADVNDVSCAAPGDCAAGGSYAAGRVGDSTQEPWLASEVNGVWQPAQTVAGLTEPGAGGEIDLVSCAAPGDCTAIGFSNGNRGSTFAVAETDGRWGNAGTLPDAAEVGIGSLSCPSPGNCAAVGVASAGAVVMEEVNGHWGNPMRVRGMPASGASLPLVSCPSAGNCVAAGSYTTDRSPDGVAMEVTETDRHWGSARVLPGVAASSVSCAAPGYCTVLTDGDIFGPDGYGAPATGDIVDEMDGGWLRPIATPGFLPGTVSCSAPGYCSASAYWALGDADDPDEAAIAVADETAGAWGPWNLLQETITWPSLEAEAVVDPLSCGAPGNCAIHGYFDDQYGPAAEWAAAKSLVPATATSLSLPASPPVYGHEQAAHFSVTVLASSGTPTGQVGIVSGQTTLCTVTLTAGQGDCTPAATGLAGGTYRVAADYGIFAGFASSHSGQAALVIARAATVTRLALTHPSVGYGDERSELIKVSVTPRYRGIPGGTVTVMTGKITLCTIRLSARKGACSPGPRALRPGRYRLTARYQGSRDFSLSTSAPGRLVILPG